MVIRHSQSTVGIECCDHQVRAVHMTTIKKQVHLNATAIVDIQHDSQKGQLAALTKVRQLLNYKREHTIFAMNHNDVITKTMHIDATLNDHEIMKYLTAQAVRIFSYPDNDIFIDYLPIDTSQESPQQIQAIAAREKQINLFRKLSAISHFRLKAIDVDAFAIGRIIPFLDKNHCHKACIAIVYLKQRQLLFCVFNNIKNIYAATVDYPPQNAHQPEPVICIAFNHALQFFNNARPGYVINNAILMGNANYSQSTLQALSMKASFEIAMAQISPHQTEISSLDPRLFCSFGAALWRAPQ